jgi:hypothetical protein
MKNHIRKAVPVLMTLGLFAASACVQTMAADSAAPASLNAPTATSHAKSHKEFVDNKINELHAQLKITPQQSRQWDAYAQTIRDNARTMGQAFRERAQKLPSMNADEAMKSYAALARLHADNMQNLATAFNTLYQTLSPGQKKTADSLFQKRHKKQRVSPH